jgi:uncharacterized membrane protein
MKPARNGGAVPALSERSESNGRRGYLDWLRGLAVLVMIEAHVLDSWTRLDHRDSGLFGASMILGGFGAPLFLFLAGVSVSLSAGSKVRRHHDRQAAARAVMRRGLEIFGLAFLFRLQAFIISWGSWLSLLKVDILNIMGPSIVAAAALWGGAKSSRGRLLVFALITLLVSTLTPLVRAVEFLHPLPDPIEGYLRPRPGFTNFAIFPWAAFVSAGAFVGVLIDATRTVETERRINVRIALGGALLTAAAYGGSHLPTLLPNSQFWTSSPSFFLIRTGVLVTAVGVAYAWSLRRRTISSWSPLEQIGRTSLFIYWIHIELIYGLMVRPLHKSLTLGEAWVGVMAFSVLMVIVSLVKERVASHVRRRSTRVLIPAP